MGTRHLICVALNGEMKVANYGQWDGNPTGQGETVAQFIGKYMVLDDFKKAVSECVFISGSEVDKRLDECGFVDGSAPMLGVECKRFQSRYPELDRDTGAEILRLIQDHGKRRLVDSSNFGKESLFCEWAYVLDLDKEVLEVYKGFQKTAPPKGSRFGTRRKKGNEFYPVAMVAKFSFKNLQDSYFGKMEKLENRLNGTDEDESEVA